MPADPSDLHVADAIVFENSGGAQHVGVVAEVNSDGSVDLVDGDFYDPSIHNIHVEYDTNITDLSQWATGQWGSGTKYYLVSPQLASPAPAASGPSGPAVSNPLSGTLEVYGTGADHGLDETFWAPGPGWSSLEVPGSAGLVAGRPSAVYDPLGGNLEVYSRGGNGDLEEFYYAPGKGWRSNQLTAPGPGALTGSPSAVYDPTPSPAPARSASTTTPAATAGRPKTSAAHSSTCNLPPAGYGSDMTVMSGAGVVVTGGGGGIGRAFARRLAAGGARVVVNDLDPAAAAAVAEEINGLAVPADIGTAQGVSDLVEAARRHLGQIDVYCSNAGTGGGTDSDTPDDGWQRAWEVNALAHVRAARALLPGWLARGEGTFVVTASAAGLLTMLGSAPYSVTKHAAVAFAEWLAATYAHRGLTVHCVCPQGVRTQMLKDSGRAGEVILAATAIEPEQVAEALWQAMADKSFLVLPHPQVRDYYALRATDTDKWLRGMSRLQRRIEEQIEEETA